MYDPRTRLAQDVIRSVNAYFKYKIFSTIIPRNIRLSEAPSHGMPISLYDPQCSGARAYRNLSLELIQRDSAGAEKKNQNTETNSLDGGKHGA
jgi:chromosome partitioning protein